MDSPAVPIRPVPPRPHPPPPPVQHSYGTRIRQNSVIRPSARLRQSSDAVPPPRRIKPAPGAGKPRQPSTPDVPASSCMPEFPPPHVMLHPDDATNKAFLAMGRAFTSVDNRAMTIKDLADMCMKYGLIAQNVSAASQSITTYLRAHLQRCEVQEDHPLLSRHTLSGTPSDDDLVAALYSRTGGAHCALSPGDNRLTNFRRGTQVWYLSRAAGAPCPFTRAGIRLCEYTEDGKIGAASSKDPRERKRERDRLRRAGMCGEKRKRLTRACAGGRQEGSESASDSEQRPPKVKLTLRLKPSPCSASPSPSVSAPSSVPSLSSACPGSREIIDLSNDGDESDEDSMSVDSSSSSSSDEESDEEGQPAYYGPSSPSAPCFSMPSPSSFSYRRSPSVPSSVASPPPDSDDEADFYRSSMQFRSASSDRAPWDDDDDIDWELEEDDDEAEGPSFDSQNEPTTPAPYEDNVFVKQESCDDIGGMLDAWENLDNRVANLKVIDVVTQAAAASLSASTSKVKIEEPEFWDSDVLGAASSPGFDDDSYPVKEEEDDFVPPLVASDAVPFGAGDDDLVCGSPLTPLSAFSPDVETGETRWASQRRPSELMWKDAELLGPDSILPQELEEGHWDAKRTKREGSPLRALSEPLSELSPLPDTPSPSAESDDTRGPSTPPPVSLPFSVPHWKSPDSVSGAVTLGSPALRPRLVASDEDGAKSQDEVVVVHTCEPCEPAISATQLEGISVYQMTIGTSRLLRRIDTDFVNLAPIIHHFNLDVPTTVPNATVIAHGSPAVLGTWVPLQEAQAFARAHGPAADMLDVFLADELFERFPPALQDFHRSNARARLLNRFGPHFASTRGVRRRGIPLSEACTPWERGMMSHADVEEHLLAAHPSLAKLSLPPKQQEVADKPVIEAPLSPIEEQMFQTLCDLSGWETPPLDAALKVADLPGTEDAEMEAENVPEPPAVVRRRSCSRDRPLRRSKRVATALATRPRTRSTKGGTRNSLS